MQGSNITHKVSLIAWYHVKIKLFVDLTDWIQKVLALCAVLYLLGTLFICNKFAYFQVATLLIFWKNNEILVGFG